MLDRLHTITAVAATTTVAAIAAIVLAAGPARAHQQLPVGPPPDARLSFAQETAARLGAAQVEKMYHDAPAAVHDRCTRTVDVPGQGRSCRLAGGLWGVRLDDGSTVATHGPDYLDASVPVLSPSSALGLADAGDIAGHPDDSAYVACAADATQPHYRAIYARRANSSSDANAVVNAVRVALRQASQFIHDQSALDLAPPGGEARLRLACTPGHSIDVKTVEVPSATRIDIATLRAQLAAAGANAGPEAATSRMVVYYDGPNSSSAAGQGSIFADDVASATNQNNGADTFAVQYYTNGTPSWDVFLHEMMHNMGATQNGAPGSNGHGHCTEDADVMCYDEFGVNTKANPACTTTQLDCGRDTYFNASPSPKGWLATHWNAGSPLNSWLDFGTRNIDTAPPSAPSLPRILDVTETTVHLAWDPSADASPIVTYRAYARASTSGGAAATVTNAGTATTATITGLTAGGTYYVHVDATDAAGNVSRPGPEQPVTLPTPPPAKALAPAAPAHLSVGTRQPGGPTTSSSPTRLSVDDLRDSRATLSWTTGAGGGATTSFRIVMRDESTGRVRTVTVPGTDRLASISLPAGYVTTIRVVAYGPAGTASSAPITAVGTGSARGCTWVAGDRTPPTRPRALSMSRALAGMLAVRWKRSVDANGVCAYRRLKLVRGRWVTAGAPIDARLVSTVISGLRRATGQRVAIQAIDAAGNLSARAELLARTR